MAPGERVCHCNKDSRHRLRAIIHSKNQTRVIRFGPHRIQHVSHVYHIRQIVHKFNCYVQVHKYVHQCRTFRQCGYFFFRGRGIELQLWGKLSCEKISKCAYKDSNWTDLHHLITSRLTVSQLLTLLINLQ